MVKMQCKECRDVKFSAASDNLDCSCGGKLKVMPLTRDEQITKLDEATIELFNFTDLLKREFKLSFN